MTGRHTYDRSVVPPYDADLGPATARHLRRVRGASLLVLIAELVIAVASALWGPPGVRWAVYGGGPRWVGELWDVVVPSSVVPVLVLALVTPGALLMAIAGSPLARRLAAGEPHRGVPPLMIVGTTLANVPSLSLTLAVLTAVLGWGDAGAITAAAMPELGSMMLAGYLVSRRSALDPWIWAESHRDGAPAVP
jgi:hypothetical protein